MHIWRTYVVKVSATAAMFAIQLGGAFWSSWRKRRSGAAVSMTLGVDTARNRRARYRCVASCSSGGGDSIVVVGGLAVAPARLTYRAGWVRYAVRPLVRRRANMAI